MHQHEYEMLDDAIDVVARHVSRALIAMENMRRSALPAQREAYREVHDLMGDLGSIKVRLACMDPARPDNGRGGHLGHADPQLG